MVGCCFVGELRLRAAGGAYRVAQCPVCLPYARGGERVEGELIEVTVELGCMTAFECVCNTTMYVRSSSTAARGEVDDLLEPESLWPERTMLRASSAKECLATESARSKIDQPWCVTRQPNLHDRP
jgi:hypothetical protein